MYPTANKDVSPQKKDNKTKDCHGTHTLEGGKPLEKFQNKSFHEYTKKITGSQRSNEQHLYKFFQVRLLH